MTEIYNQNWSKERRRELRANSTRAEDVLWELLRDRKLENIKFRRQYGVGGYILDFYAPQYKLAIELDGSVHDTLDAKEYDRIRDEYLREVGIEILRIRNEDVVIPRFQESTLKRISAALHLRLKAHPSLPRRG